MIKSIVICVMVIGLTLQACDKGCLKCNSKNECVFCDTSNNYYLSGVDCKVSTLSNCLILNLNGECGQCGPNYYLDNSTKKCVAVETLKQVANCANYGTGQACIRCVKNYFISAGKCVAVTKLIDSCEFYSDDGKCAACSSGYLFNATRDGCVASPNTAGCNAYTFLGCKTCAAGYIANPNLYFTSYQVSSAAIYSFIRTSISGPVNDWTPLSWCQKYQDANCLVASSYNVCTVCKAGYFLTAAKACRAYPKPIIEACQTYNSLTTCSGCLTGYFLETSTKCTLIAGTRLITDCISYSSTASSVVCTQCIASKYLSGNTCSSARNDSLNIENCKTNQVDADKCQICIDGYLVTSDGKKCLLAIANCKTYATSSSANSAFTCQACDDTFYLNTVGSVTSCLPGGLDGCLVYSSSNSCSACNIAAYYLQNSQCKKHVIVPNCATYSGSNANQCAVCNTGFYPFILNTVCSPVTVIANCVTYSTATTCGACATGYYLQSNLCKAIADNFANCKAVAVGNSVTCTACNDGFALYTPASGSPTCIAIHNYISDQCDTLYTDATFKDISNADNDSCAVCKESSYSFGLDNLYACVSDSILYTKVADANKVSGCKRYSNDATPVCLQCTSGNYLSIISNVRTCVSSCDLTTKTNILEDVAEGSFNLCVPQADFAVGCSIGTKAWVSGALSPVCLKFATGYPVATIPTSNTPNNSYWRDIDGSSVTQPSGSFLYFGFTITSNASVNHDNQGSTAKNCELYYSAPSNKFYCWRCKWGYAALLATSATTTNCQAITDCNTSIVYSGFPAFLNQVLTCHACNNSKSVYVVLISGTSAMTSLPSGLSADVPSVQCATPGNAYSTSAPGTITNCQVYGNFVNTPATDGKGCLACKPGYSITVANGDTFGTACSANAIDNCDMTVTQVMVNRCNNCKQVDASNNSEPKAFATYEALVCQRVVTKNCFITDNNANGGVYGCAVCMPGYTLNIDGNCEQITFPRCSDAVGALNTYNVAITSVATLAQYYAFRRLAGSAVNVAGCDNCNAGFTAIKMPSGELQCVNSPYAQANTFGTGTKFIADCAKYKNDLNTGNTPSATCSLCKNNKIVTADGTKCVTNISNCSVAQNADNTKCETCIANYFPVSGACTLQNINNCATYDGGAVSELLCATCASGYVLSANRKACTAGYVFGCNVYDADKPWSCSSCSTGYNRVTTADGATYCFKTDSGNNCSALDVANLQNGVYKCSSCTINNSAASIIAAYATSDATLPQSICLPLNLVDKCLTYGVGQATVGTNSFICTSCSAGYYADLTKNACVARVNQPSACTQYYATQDKCQVCGPSTFKVPDETDCVSFPNGILRCSTYSSDTNCTSCIAGAYLTNNTCPLSTAIDKCATYSANYTCASCISGYFLVNSTSCQLAQASGCYTYASISACEQCDPANPNKGLQTNANGVTNCVDKNVVNCDISTNVSPFSCKQCKRGFYLGQDGACAAAAAISKCLIWDSLNTCVLCEQGAVLSADRKSCNDTFYAASNDANCVDSQQLSSPVCARCNAGSFFSNNTCTSCSNNTYTGGCFLCDPSNQSTCFACRPGYYQTQNGNCVSVSGVTPTPQPSSAMIARLAALLALVFALLI